MSSLVLPSDLVAKNKAATPNKNDVGLIADTKVDASSVVGRDRNARTYLRFHKRAEHRSLSRKVKEVFRRWQSSSWTTLKSLSARHSGVITQKPIL